MILRDPQGPIRLGVVERSKAPVLEGRREHLQRSGEGVEYLSQGGEIVGEVRLLEFPHQRLDPGDHLSHGERAVIGGPQHHQPPPHPTCARFVPHPLPSLRMVGDEGARGQSAHRVRDQMNGLALSKPLDDAIVQIGGGEVETLAPIEEERFDRPIVRQPQQQLPVVLFEDAAGPHLPTRGRVGHPVGGEAEPVEAAEDDARDADPKEIIVAGLIGGELGSHDPVNHNHVSLNRSLPAGQAP